ncbi:DNA damage-binding protein 1 [Phanerochaete sordida]|uniref:DNA damage-binding protein 1 n=1 Tax=Phanerochaete sordida TaxID=48140 RepID=A0A9P3FWQ7_9APHY|nr:DNA damage-binding protein 1 [Phanerochaete sordida]
MKVVTTLHQPSAVVSSVKCRLASNYELGHLVVAKTNRVEVSSIHPEGLKRECGLDIWGRVLSIRAVPAGAEDVSNLLVLTDHPYPKLILLTLHVEDDTRELREKWSTDLHDRNARHAEYLNDIVVHPAGRAAIISCYAGKLKVVTFKKGGVDKDFDVILPELNLLALSFLYYEPNAHTHTVAIVHIDHRQRIQLLARELAVDARDLAVEIAHAIPHTILPANHFPFTELPLKLVSVPAFSLAQTPDAEDAVDQPAKCRGGVIVLGGRKVNFYELSDKKTVRDLKNKAQRQTKRRASGNAEQIRVAEEKDAQRDLKKVKPRATVKWPWSEVAVCCPADDEMRRFFVGDAYGRLSLLTLNDAPEFIIIPLGETSPPTTLSYLSSQVLYVGSVLGDSQLVRIAPAPVSDADSDTLPIPGGIQTIRPAELAAPRAESPDDDYDMRDAFDARDGRGGKIVRTKGRFLDVLARVRNIAPIMDVVLADPDESGQPQIITCSGGANTGSLNVVRTGADFQEMAVLNGVANVTNMWPIRTSFESSSDAYVLTTTLFESSLLRFDDRESLTRVDASVAGFVTNVPTIAVANIPLRATQQGTSTYVDSSLVVQVTSHGLNLVEYDPALGSFSKVGNGWSLQQQPNPLWKVKEIVAASINPSQFAVALNGGSVLLFNLSPDRQITLIQSREFPDREIARLSCAPLDASKNFSPFVAVAFWQTNTVALLSTKDPARPLSTHAESGALPALAHSLLLHNFGLGRNTSDVDFQPYVVAGLVDGTVACIGFRNNELREQKLFSLGVVPVSLSVVKIDAKRAVFATGSRAAVFYWDKQRLRQSPVMLKNITVGVGLNTAAYPSCEILATPSSLVIGQIRGVDKMQIRSIPLGCENPRRIAYHPGLNVFGVSLVKSAPARVGEAELQDSTFRILDGITFNTISSFLAEPDEEVSAVLALPTGALGAFMVGTVRHQHGEFEPSSGRLILFDLVPVIGGERELRKLAEVEANGCVYALASVENGVAVAVNTAVELYAPVQHENSFALNKVSSWNHNYFVTSLVAKGDRLICGDAISSVSVLEVLNNNLKTVARDYGPVWPVALEATKDGGVIGANTDGNLFTFALPEDGAARNVLERTGSYHLGELVNTFVPGGPASGATAAAEQVLFETEQLFATSSGRLALVHHVADDGVALALTALQRNMGGLLVGPGETRHAQWRTPANARGRSDAEDTATGFLDGDFLEAFLTHPEPAKLLAGRNDAERIAMSVEQVEGILEKLQSLH